jgi:hypothetical protein
MANCQLHFDQEGDQSTNPLRRRHSGFVAHPLHENHAIYVGPAVSVASHADPRTTMRYDRARVSLDRHATYIVAAFVAGAAR